MLDDQQIPVQGAFIDGLEIRKWIGFREEVWRVGGETADQPLVKAVAGVLLRNPFASRYSEELSALIRPSRLLGSKLGALSKSLLGGIPIESYGKGGIAGTSGEQEHVVACITSVFGDAFRESIGGGDAWISSVTKVDGPGATIDIPLAFKDDIWVRSHYDAITVNVADGPKPDELFICVGVASRGRIGSRVGGLSKEDSKAKRSLE